MEKLVDTLYKIRDTYSLFDEKFVQAEVFDVWNTMVGSPMHQRVRPVRYQQGVLHLVCDHPVWMQTCVSSKYAYLHKLNQLLYVRHVPPLKDLVCFSAQASSRSPLRCFVKKPFADF